MNKQFEIQPVEELGVKKIVIRSDIEKVPESITVIAEKDKDFVRILQSSDDITQSLSLILADIGDVKISKDAFIKSLENVIKIIKEG